MNSWVKITDTLTYDRSMSMQNVKVVYAESITKITTIQSALSTNLLSKNTQRLQKASSSTSPIEWVQLQNQLVTASINACVEACSQFLPISGSYRNRTPQRAEESLFALGDSANG